VGGTLEKLQTKTEAEERNDQGKREVKGGKHSRFSQVQINTGVGGGVRKLSQTATRQEKGRR